MERREGWRDGGRGSEREGEGWREGGREERLLGNNVNNG